LLLVEKQELRILDLAGRGVEVLARRNFAAADADQLGFELLAVAGREARDQVPPGGRAEGHPLSFAFDNQAHGHALHAAGGKACPYLFPEQWRDLVAV
jgi:hypothetical protein